jgi:TetR/AcrR family transcriptional repressor of mexJK operon
MERTAAGDLKLVIMGESRKPAAKESNDHEARILAAAADIFFEKGYKETSTADIARGARVSKRELYANFADKRDILSAVVAEMQNEMQAQANISWTSTGDLSTVLIDAGIQISEFINSEKFGKLLRIVVAESFSDPAAAERFYQLGPGRGRDSTAAFMRRQIKLGNLRKADPLQAADDFLNLIVSSRRLTAVVLGRPLDSRKTKKRVRHAVDLFLQYYGTGKR